MKTRWMIVSLVLALAVGSILPVGAQGVVNLSIDELQHGDFPRMQAQVTVRNENGVPIVGLGPGNFEIVEDGQTSFPPAEVTAQTNPEAVISVVMVIDVSGSMKGKPIKEAIRAANALIEQLSPQDRGAVIAFADHVNTDPTQLEEGKEIGFTTDKNALRNVVNFLETQIGWDTPLYDAIYKGVKMASVEPAGKRAVIAMTDGRDERDNAQGVPIKDAGSFFSADDPIAEANRYNIPIFSIGLVGLGGKIDTRYLRKLAERTGGVYQKAPQPEELTPLFQNVVNQLKQQYVLTYDSTLPDDDAYHSLLVRVQVPQGQDFDEVKFQINPSVEPPPPATAPPGEAPPVVPTVPEGAPAASPTPTPTPTPTGVIGFIRTTIEERPLLAVVVGVGLLLLFILLIALVIVLLRGREREDDTAEIPLYTPSPVSTPGPTGPGAPATPTPAAGGMDTTAPDWSGVRAGAPAGGPPVGQAATGPGIPQAGGTVVIERGPKRLAMLVDKARPERKYDLKGTTNIGRARANQVVLADPTVSRRHAWIKAEGEDFIVFDVGSGNGTYVNDQRITEPRRLKNGDVIGFGEAEFVFTRVF